MEYKAPKSTLQLQTVRVSILIGDALAASDHRFDSTPDNNDNNNHHSGSVPSARINGHIPPGNVPLPLLPEMRILAPLDLLKVPMSDGVTPHVKIDDVGAIHLPHEVLGECKSFSYVKLLFQSFFLSTASSSSNMPEQFRKRFFSCPALSS